MESIRSTASALRRPFAEGDAVLVVEPRGKRHLVRLRPGGRFFQRKTGSLCHDRLLGQPPGVLVHSDEEVPLRCLRPTLEDFILKRLQRPTSIIHPKDLASLVMRGDLFPGARVLEAGMGSGATTILLLRLLGGDGYLISYERREEFSEKALANIAEFRRESGGQGAQHRVVHGDVCDGLEAEDLDLVIFDLPEPHLATSGAAAALRAGGVLMCWLPTVTQVYQLVRHLQKDQNWTAVETQETIQRDWNVAPDAMRPVHRMIAHTGFWIRARRVVAAS